MNNILVINNKIPHINNDIINCDNNHIIIKKNVDFNIEYINCDNINLTIEFLDNITTNIFEYSVDNTITINTTYTIGKNTIVNISKFYNNKKCNETININLNKENAIINYNFICISDNNEEYTLLINHNSPKTISSITNSAIVLNDSALEFNINSYLPKNNPKCLLNQESKIITMGQNNSIIKPNMFIEEADVTAKHASTIGKFNEDDIFYLMTRGLSYNESIKLLIKGFLFRNLNCPIENREKILSIFNKYWRW